MNQHLLKRDVATTVAIIAAGSSLEHVAPSADSTPSDSPNSSVTSGLLRTAMNPLSLKEEGK